MRKFMFRYIFVACAMLAAIPCSASKKDGPFRDAVFVSKHTATANAVSCSSTSSPVTAETLDCHVPGMEVFEITMGNVRMLLTPFVATYNRGLIGAVSHAVTKNASLNRVLPGDHVLIRAESSGVRIKVGDYESMYSIQVSEPLTVPPQQP